MSNLVCDLYDDDGALDGPWHWSEVLCSGCVEGQIDSPVRVSPRSASWEKCERCGKLPSESLDSSLDADDEEVPPPSQPEKLLSPAQSIALIIGHERMSHAEAVRRVYAYIEANGLHDPEAQRIILCDSTLEAALGVPKVSLFALSKLVLSKLQ
jgi:DNA topoisomerase-1